MLLQSRGQDNPGALPAAYQTAFFPPLTPVALFLEVKVHDPTTAATAMLFLIISANPSVSLCLNPLLARSQPRSAPSFFFSLPTTLSSSFICSEYIFFRRAHFPVYGSFLFSPNKKDYSFIFFLTFGLFFLRSSYDPDQVPQWGPNPPMTRQKSGSSPPSPPFFFLELCSYNFLALKHLCGLAFSAPFGPFFFLVKAGRFSFFYELVPRSTFMLISFWAIPLGRLNKVLPFHWHDPQRFFYCRTSLVCDYGFYQIVLLELPF